MRYLPRFPLFSRTLQQCRRVGSRRLPHFRWPSAGLDRFTGCEPLGEQDVERTIDFCRGFVASEHIAADLLASEPQRVALERVQDAVGSGITESLPEDVASGIGTIVPDGQGRLE